MEPGDIVAKMMEKDFFSQWLGISVLSVEKGYCRISMTVRKEMLNGFGIVHGGISYSLADSALAFASNAGGIHSLSIETSIAHVNRINESDTLFAEARCVTETEKLGHYEVRINTEPDDKPLALFRGMVYKTHKVWK